MSYAVSTVSISMVLFLLGSVGWLIAGLIGAADRMRGNVEVSVMLAEDADRAALEKKLKALEGVGEVVFVSKEDAAREFIDASGDDFTEFLDYNPLPDSFTVRVDAELGVAALEKAAAGWEGVSEVVYQRAVVEKIANNIGKFQLVLLVFGCVLAVISVVLLNNTIRVSVYSKKHIIGTMKLVGAESGFIMQPFVRNSLVQGLWAAVIASVMFLLLAAGLGEELPKITLVRFSPLWIVAGMFVAGMLISLTFTTMTVAKFLRMHTNAIHLY
jgi:cell division transport system permease protein